MIRNYLKGVIGDAMNLMLGAAAMNFKRLMNILKKNGLVFWQNCFGILIAYRNFLLNLNQKLTF